MKLQAEGVSRQLRGWADSLPNSSVKGQRYLTDKGKRSAKEAREREEFLDELRKVRAGSPATSGRKEHE